MLSPSMAATCQAGGFKNYIYATKGSHAMQTTFKGRPPQDRRWSGERRLFGSQGSPNHPGPFRRLECRRVRDTLVLPKSRDVEHPTPWIVTEAGKKNPALVEAIKKACPDVKETNPKDALGSSRIPLSLPSDIANAEEALALVEGKLKYGGYNYRVSGVRATIYIDAARRHLAKWLNGEDRDPKTGVHHLGNVRACMSIIFDGLAMGNIVDDRPPKIDGFSEKLDALEANVKHLQEVFKDRNPKHFTEKNK